MNVLSEDALQPCEYTAIVKCLINQIDEQIHTNNMPKLMLLQEPLAQWIAAGNVIKESICSAFNEEDPLIQAALNEIDDILSYLEQLQDYIFLILDEYERLNNANPCA